MIKRHKTSIIIGCMIILLPVVIGLLLWNQLPNEIATHFDSNGQPNGWSSKAFTVLGIPAILLLIHLACVFFTAADPKKQNIHDKLFTLILWIVPVISLLVCPASYAIALGMELNIESLTSVLVGIIFILSGNYMHKVKQNYTIGIKIPWTLDSEENWNRTHRLSSWLWILCGILFLANSFLRISIILLPCILVIAFVPMVYSFILYKKGI